MFVLVFKKPNKLSITGVLIHTIEKEQKEKAKIHKQIKKLSYLHQKHRYLKQAGSEFTEV